MDRFQLCEALRAAGIPDMYYEIPGCSHGPYPADRYFLEERAGVWVVGVHERGSKKVLARFAHQDGACQWLFDRLTDQGPPPVPPTSEEAAALLYGSEDIQRRAREDFERALGEARRRAHVDDGRTEPPPTG
ncbi:hypothetical protein [Catenulispora subtropica]|uniref:Immunity protein 63 domain-containing protein n=1 Tax=Catenulispora subtropica TaxID=450798 RepID=A0ABN2RMN7_9ACTN